jgi:hypothetical protein
MGFADVDGEEVGAVFVIVVKIGEVAYLAAEWRSGVAAENEDERSATDAVAQLECGITVEADQRRIRGAIANVQIALAPMGERVP